MILVFVKQKVLKLFLLKINHLYKLCKNIYIIICYIKLFVIYLQHQNRTKYNN